MGPSGSTETPTDGGASAHGAEVGRRRRAAWTEEQELAAVAARRFYLDDATKVTIANELGVSRFKVARLLELARESGIVTIELHDTGVPDEALTQRLCEHLRLDECLVVNSRGTEDDVREQVAAAAADVLESTLRDDDVLGLAWGRTVAAMTRALGRLPPVTIVQINGAASNQPEDSPVETVRRASLSTGGTAYAFHLPLIVSDARTAEALRTQPDVAATMQRFADITIAVVSLGSWAPPSSQIHDCLAPAERAALLERGVQGDLACTLLDREGSIVDEGFLDRTLAIRPHQLHAIPRVVAVAGGAIKANAVMAAARSGLMTGLITDRSLAEQVLAMPFEA